MEDEKLFTPEEIAARFKLSKYTVYEMVKRGELPAYRIGRSIRISERQVEQFMAGVIKKENVYDVALVDENGSQYAELSDDLRIAVSSTLNGQAKIHIRPEDVILSKTPIISSARNVHKGIVTEIDFENNGVKITLDIGVHLSARISKKSTEEMGIRIGDEMYGVFKTMAVDVYK